MPPPIPMSEKTRIKKAKETKEEKRIFTENRLKKIPVLLTRISGNKSSFFGFNAKGKYNYNNDLVFKN